LFLGKNDLFLGKNNLFLGKNCSFLGKNDLFLGKNRRGSQGGAGYVFAGLLHWLYTLLGYTYTRLARPIRKPARTGFLIG
jgi:hypothetical protein